MAYSNPPTETVETEQSTNFMKLFATLAILTIPAIAQAAAHSVTLSWGASPTTGVTYNLYRFTGPCTSAPAPGTGGFTQIDSGIQVSLVSTDTSVLGATTYCYAVSASLQGVESVGDPTIQALTPPDPILPMAPVNFKLVAVK